MLPQTEAQQIALAQAGDMRARDGVIARHVPLVYFVLNERYRRPPSHIDPEDLVSAGMVGLVLSVDRFDPTYGVQFNTFAGANIACSMARWMRHEDPISPAMWERDRAIRLAERRVMRKGLALTEAAVAAELKVTVPRLARLRELSVRKQRVPLDSPVGQNCDQPVAEYLPGGDDTETEALLHCDAEFIRRVVDSLPPKQRELIVQRHFMHRTNAEVGRALGKSREYIRTAGNAADEALKARLLEAGWVA